MRKLQKEVFNDPEGKYLLVACGDGYAELLAKHKEELSKHFLFAANDYDLFKKLSNKVSFYETCEEYQLFIQNPAIITKDMAQDGKPDRHCHLISRWH